MRLCERLCAKTITVYLLLGATLSLLSCAQTGSLNSNVAPTKPVITFPNASGARSQTMILSNPFGQQAGIAGTAFLISMLTPSGAIDQLAIDSDGNLGIRGSFNSLVTNPPPNKIVPVSFDALSLVRSTSVRAYHLKSEQKVSPAHVGFISTENSALLSGANHNALNVDNTVLINIAALKQLDQQVQDLRAEVRKLHGR